MTSAETGAVTHDYRDESGALLFQVVRKPNKVFRQRRPDGRDGWVWNLQGVRLVLYRLPELLAADPAEPVFVVEGEKDVDGLRALGFAATTNPQGPGKWLAEYSVALRGRQVVAIPDNDGAGRSHMEEVARSVYGLGIPVTVLVLPGLPPKGGVSDWIAAGGTGDGLRRLVSETQPWTPARSVIAAARACVVTMADVRPERVDWLWPGRIPRGKITLLEGDPGLGKSTVAYDLAARLSSARPMPGLATPATAADAIIISHEDGLGDTVRPRLEAAGADLRRVHAVKGFGLDGTERLPVLPADVPIIEAIVEQHAAALLIIDPLFAYLGSEIDTFKDHDVRAALVTLAAMAERTRVAVLIVRHLNKRSGGPAIYRGGGSIGIIGLARSGLLVAPDPDDSAGRVLASVKNNLATGIPSMRWRLVPEDNGAARVEWLGLSSHTAETLLANCEGEPEERSALDEACAFLKDALAGGEVEVQEVRRRAAQAGVTGHLGAGEAADRRPAPQARLLRPVRVVPARRGRGGDGEVGALRSSRDARLRQPRG
jgi:hypothetical protein